MLTTSCKMGTNFIKVIILVAVFFNRNIYADESKFTVCGETRFKQRLDCVLGTSDGPKFARVTYEEALSSPFWDKIYVHSEIRPKNGPTKAAAIEIVVVVKDKSITNFKGLKGAKVCYPGFNDSNVARYFISDFENTILNTIYNDSCLEYNYPHMGKQIKGLKDFFSESCRPGIWVNHKEIDNALKHTFSDLCKLCDESEDYGCSTVQVKDPFQYALDCFEKNGTVAILSKDLAQTLESPLYLTRKGTVETTPDVWTVKPWDFVISNKKNSIKIELSNNNETTIHLETPLTIEKYLTGVVNGNQVKLACSPKLNWCTYLDRETDECELLKAVISQQKIPLDLECTEKIDKIECINSVAQNETHILTAQNIYGYIARSNSLVPIAFPGVTVANASRSMVVVKSDDKEINSLKDLKEKFGCFSQFGDIAFISFLSELQQQGIIKKTCTLDEFLENFVGVSCIPGIIDPNWENLPSSVDISTYCKCAGGPTSKTDLQCSASNENQYFENGGALKCLSNIGNYAIVTENDIENLLNGKEYSVLCKNNQRKHFSQIFKDDEDCFLSITTNQEIMIRKNDILLVDTVAMLSDLELLPKDYGLFDNLKNLIFQNSVSKLYFTADNDRFVDNYKKVFSNFDQCMDNDETNSARNVISRFYTYILPIFVLYLCN